MSKQINQDDHAVEPITVFGGSGFLGRHLIPALIKGGHRVRVAVRDTARAAKLFADLPTDALAYKSTDISQASDVGTAVEGSSAVVNLVGILFETGAQKFDAVQALGPANIANAANAAGIERLVQVSAIGADQGSEASYARTKAVGEQSVLEAVPSAVVLRPSIVFGPEDQFFNRFAAMSKLLPIVPVVGPDTRFQPVYVDDVASAIVKAIGGEAKPGAIYELGGPDIDTFRGLMETMLQVLNRRRAVLALPIPLAKIQATFMELLPTPPLTRDQIKLLGKDNIVSEGAITEGLTLEGLGITAKSIAEKLPTYLR